MLCLDDDDDGVFDQYALPVWSAIHVRPRTVYYSSMRYAMEAYISGY